jgi:hypothetical protein
MSAKPKLTVLAWNVYIGNTVAQVRGNLNRLINFNNPEVIVLMEASKMYGHLDGLGYKVVQLMPKPIRPGNQPGQGNVAILVRNDIKILRRVSLRMKTFWLGPKHGWPQDPRVYRAVKIQFGAKKWKVLGAHTPFGTAARDESRRKLVRWLKAGILRRPKVLVLDANMGLGEFRSTIAQPGGALAGGVGIDLEAHKDCTLVSAKDLGHNGSDHPAMLYEFEAK